MQVTVSIGRRIVVYYDIHAFHIDSAAENIRSDENALLEVFELFIPWNPEQIWASIQKYFLVTHRSSCWSPEWIEMLGKLHSRRSLSSSFALATDFTKITTSSKLNRHPHTELLYSLGWTQGYPVAHWASDSLLPPQAWHKIVEDREVSTSFHHRQRFPEAKKMNEHIRIQQRSNIH